MTAFVRLTLLTALAFSISACAQQTDSSKTAAGNNAEKPAAAAQKDLATAIFAGGCFWCMEEPFDVLDGVVSTTSGYTGGRTENPTYREVTGGNTGHAEAVEIKYNADKISYEKLLDVFWHNVDPTDAGGQFCDRGDSYRTGIFTVNEQQMKLARASKNKLRNKVGAPSPIVTEIEQGGEFYVAEDYHQNYYQTTPIRYKFYRSACGRDSRLEELWGDAAGGH